MELYTSLTRLKQSLNGGELPPMTPLTEEAKKLIDPAFVEGMGGLIEDEKKGLRCPVRGCGKWTHSLSMHWRRRHFLTIGPVGVLRDILEIPGVPLLSRHARARYKAASINRRPPRPCKANSHSVSAVKKRGAARVANARSMNHRNGRKVCDKQMAERYMAVRGKVGREPTRTDADIHDPGLSWAALEYYGGWNAFRSTISDRISKRGYTVDDILVSMRSYWDCHGRLPELPQVRDPDRRPLIPSAGAILKTLEMTSWPKAMSHVAWLLGVQDPNYSPKRAVAEPHGNKAEPVGNRPRTRPTRAA